MKIDSLFYSIRRGAVALLLLILGLLPQYAEACADTTMRDAAFQGRRDVHRLCVIDKANGPDGQEIYAQLEHWLKTSGAGLNVEILRVSVDDPDLRWNEYGIPSAPPSFPVVVFAGNHQWENRRFFVHHWEPAPSSEDLAALRTSPAREAIRKEVPGKLAVLVYVPGTDGTTKNVKNILTRVVETWSQKERLGISVVHVNRSDERERLFFSFLGIPKTGPDWVAVAFGRGKMMQPLQGSEITEAELNAEIEQLVGNCTCLRSPSSLGVDIPMVWEDSLDTQIIALRSQSDAASLALHPPPLPARNVPTMERFTMARLLWTSVSLILVVILASITIVWRKNR